ncbi:MAG: cell wall hydrolase [Chloroflexota bacterium]
MQKTLVVVGTILITVLLILEACAPAQTSTLPSTSAPMASTSEDIEWLATVITSEAGSVYEKGNWVRCTDEERASVGWTVLNRFRSGTFGQTIKEVVTATGQYAHKQEPTSEIREFAKKLLEGGIPDATGGATYFFSPVSMPKEGEPTAGFDTGGGLHSVTGVDKKVYFPSWTNTMAYAGDLRNVRQAYFMFYRTETPAPPAPEVSQPAPKNIIKMTIGELVSFNSQQAGKRGDYSGKIIQTLGEVKTRQSTQKGYVITFKPYYEKVNLIFEKEPSSVKVGQRIAVRGQWAGGTYESGYDLVNCVLVSPVKVSAEDLYADFQTNAIAAELKYKTEIVQIRGEVSIIQRNAVLGGIEVWLVGDKEGGSLRLRFGSEWESSIAGLKVGQVIGANGEFDTSYGAQIILTFSECSLLE